MFTAGLPAAISASHSRALAMNTLYSCRVLQRLTTGSLWPLFI
jgi:hypothetical protein